MQTSYLKNIGVKLECKITTFYSIENPVHFLK